MSTNEIYTVASELVFPVHSSVASGDLVQVGEVIGVAHADAVTGEDGNTYATLKLDGAFQFTIADSVTLAAGDVAYGSADSTTGVIAEVNATNTDKVIGHVVKVTATDAVVRLVQSA